MRCQRCGAEHLVRNVPGVGEICYKCLREVSEELLDIYENLKNDITEMVKRDIEEIVNTSRDIGSSVWRSIISEYMFGIILGNMFTDPDVSEDVKTAIADYLFGGNGR